MELDLLFLAVGLESRDRRVYHLELRRHIERELVERLAELGARLALGIGQTELGRLAREHGPQRRKLVAELISPAAFAALHEKHIGAFAGDRPRAILQELAHDMPAGLVHVLREDLVDLGRGADLAERRERAPSHRRRGYRGSREAAGMPIPVVVTVYNDRSFDFVTKSPPAAALLKKAAGLAKGSGVPNKDKVGKVTKAQLDEVVRLKAADLNARDGDHARRMIEGTARSMGLTVEG